jgi:hypothetical protein
MPEQEPSSKRRKMNREVEDKLYQQDLNYMQSIAMFMSLIFFILFP